MARVRTKLGTTAMDTATVVAVDVDSLCNLAANVVHLKPLPDDRPREIFLIRAQDLYFAEDTSVHIGEWTPLYVINRDLTKIITTISD